MRIPLHGRIYHFCFVHYFLLNIPLLTNQLLINYEQMTEYMKYLL